MEVTSLYIPSFLLLTLLNSNWAQKSDVALLHIDPNRLQFFTYESIRFECKSFTGSTEWRVVKKTKTEETRWETSTTSMNIIPPYETHSGEYWCENGEGERSSPLNISIVEARKVILESPVHPVMEGETVTLRCRKKKPPYDLAADFYKDGHRKKTEYDGRMTIHNVSKSDEGLYKCGISGAGKSPESRLSVRGFFTEYSPPTTTPAVHEISPLPLDPGSNQLFVVLPIIFTVLFLAVLVLGLLQCHKHKAACFSTDTQATGSARVYEEVGGTKAQDVYAKVPKNKKTRGCQETMKEDVTYATVTTRKKKARGEAHAPDSDKATYAAIRPQRKERGHRHEETAVFQQTAYQ